MQSQTVKIIPPSKFRPETYEQYLSGLVAGFQESLPDIEPDWLKDVRARNRDLVEKYGLPTPLLERWKYTNILPIIQAKSLEWHDCGNTAKAQHVRVSDITDEALAELVAGVSGQSVYQDMMVPALGDALLKNGVHVVVSAGEKDAVLELAPSIDDGQFVTTRNVIHVEAGAVLTVIEKLAGEGAYWRNSHTSFNIAEGATVHHIRVVEDAETALNTDFTDVDIAAKGDYSLWTLTTGGELSRHQVHVKLQGEEAVCNLSGAMLLDGQQQADTTFLIEHQAPNCNSNQDYRNLLSGQSKGIFQGKVHVHQVAQQTDGYQLCNTVLLSDRAEMNTKPELEIYADDVKCSHGATTSQPDEEPLFYMRARGIDHASAKALLLQAFVSEAFESLPEAHRDDLLEKVSVWLNKAL